MSAYKKCPKCNGRLHSEFGDCSACNYKQYSDEFDKLFPGWFTRKDTENKSIPTTAKKES